MTRVAVVVPTHQRPAQLERLLDALDGVEWPGDRQVVVVDDGSEPPVRVDRSGVRVVRQPNAGPAAARNRGWRSVDGEIVAFLDDDTWPEPGWLRALLEPFADPSVVGVGGRVIAGDDRFWSRFMQAERLAGHGADPGEDARFLVTANVAFRRRALEDVAGFDERLDVASEDVDLSYRLRDRGGRLVVADNAVARHDHRSRALELVRNYFRHGIGRAALARRHPDRVTAAQERRHLSPRYWVDRYRQHREAGEPVPVALAFVVLRFLFLVVFAAGMAHGRRTGRDDRVTAGEGTAVR